MLYTISTEWSLREQLIGSTVEYYYCCNGSSFLISMEILSIIFTELIFKHKNGFRVVFAKTNLEALFHFSILITRRCLGKKIACPAASKPRSVLHVNSFQQRMWKDGEPCGMSVGVCRVVRSTLKYLCVLITCEVTFWTGHSSLTLYLYFQLKPIFYFFLEHFNNFWDCHCLFPFS